jgi:hypothetical protein
MDGNKIMMNGNISAAQMAGRIEGGERRGGHVGNTKESHICKNEGRGVKNMQGKAGALCY